MDTDDVGWSTWGEDERAVDALLSDFSRPFFAPTPRLQSSDKGKGGGGGDGDEQANRRGYEPAAAFDEPHCRLCFGDEDDVDEEGESLGGFIVPCGCTGSIQFIHPACLRQLRSHRAETTTDRLLGIFSEEKKHPPAEACNTCGVRYRFEAQSFSRALLLAALQNEIVKALLSLLVVVLLAVFVGGIGLEVSRRIASLPSSHPGHSAMHAPGLDILQGRGSSEPDLERQLASKSFFWRFCLATLMVFQVNVQACAKSTWWWLKRSTADMLLLVTDRTDLLWWTGKVLWMGLEAVLRLRSPPPSPSRGTRTIVTWRQVAEDVGDAFWGPHWRSLLGGYPLGMYLPRGKSSTLERVVARHLVYTLGLRTVVRVFDILGGSMCVLSRAIDRAVGGGRSLATDCVKRNTSSEWFPAHEFGPPPASWETGWGGEEDVVFSANADFDALPYALASPSSPLLLKERLAASLLLGLLLLSVPIAVLVTRGVINDPTLSPFRPPPQLRQTEKVLCGVMRLLGWGQFLLSWSLWCIEEGCFFWVGLAYMDILNRVRKAIENQAVLDVRSVR